MPGTAAKPNGLFAAFLTRRQVADHAWGTKSEQTAVVADSFDAPDPRLPQPAAPRRELSLRVADADRDRTVTMLREHMVDGRITLDEFSERAGLALQAQTIGDLDVATANLPALAVPDATPLRRTARRKFIAVMSGSEAKGRWRVGARTTAVAVMGGCTIDLRHAEIDGPEVVITAFAFWGGIEVIVPEGIDVELEGFALMGGRNLKVRDVPIVPGSPRIRVRAYAVMGGIEVRSRRNRTGREIAKTMAQNVVDNVLTNAHASAGLAAGSSEAIDLSTLSKDIRRQVREQVKLVQRQYGDPSGSGQAPGQPVRAPAPPPVLSDSPSVGSEGTVTILFSDMVNYAGMTESIGDQASRELLREHHRIVRAALERHGGREVKVQGDGFMVAFGSVARALRCAVAMQRDFADFSSAHTERPIAVHIGVHTGEVLEEDDDFLGHTVIVASRLADAAGSGEIYVSSLSEQLVARSGEFRFGEPRDVVLKGLSRPQMAVTLLWGD